MRTRTGYSFRTAFGKLELAKKRLDEIGWKCHPISDRGSTFGFARWAKIASNPLFGIEIGVVPDLNEKKPPKDYWTFFAIDSLEPLHHLVYIATSQVEANKEMLLTYEQALKAKGLIKITGEYLLLDRISKSAKDLYIGLSPSLPRGLFRQAQKKGMKFIAVSDNRYPGKDDEEAYQVALGRQAQMQTYPQHILDDKEWKEWMKSFVDEKTMNAAIKQRNELMKRCSGIKLKKASIFVPKKPKTLLQMCREGAKRKGINLKDPTYQKRMMYELDLIKKKEFEDYFYIITDIVQFAKERMIVGPARGSSCGSLVCYLLDITAIDPIPYGLVFERFIDINRDDLPDIDIDFSDIQRQTVFDYVEKKYGEDRVARLGTVGTFRADSALNTVAIALRIPKWLTEKVKDAMIKRSSGDSRALQTIEDTLKETTLGLEMYEKYPKSLIAAQLEGHPTNASQHAAGLIITKEAIEKYVAIDFRNHTVMADKKDAEVLNMLKIDMLGLTQLSIFERCIELIGDEPSSEYLEKIPINDPAALDVMNKQHYSGIFQFNGMAVQSLAKKVKITSINDIIALGALARPGPLASGGAEEWVRRKNGAKVIYPHPIFEPFLKDTLGIIAYQEQVMRIGREIGDLTWGDVTQLRKAMSKSLGKEFFDQYGDRWKANAAKKGIDKEILEKLWDDMCAYGAWAFNKSHAVAYGTISYWCCYLKAHHPLEFAAATLDAEQNPDRQILILRELKGEGVDYVPVDTKISTDRWTISKGKLIGPLTTMEGIGEAKARDIMYARDNGEKLSPALAKQIQNPTTKIDSLYPVRDAINKQIPDLTELNIFSDPMAVVDVQPGIDDKVMIFARIDRIAPLNENEPVRVARRGRELRGPTDALNIFVSDDTDTIFCKINRFSFQQMGQPLINRARAGKSIYAIKGWVPEDFRMIRVTNIRYLCEVDGKKTGDDDESSE